MTFTETGFILNAGVLLTSVIYVAGKVLVTNRLLAPEPYRDELMNPNFKPKPERFTDKTIDQLITDAHGGLPNVVYRGFGRAVHNDSTVSVVSFDIAGTLKQEVGVALRHRPLSHQNGDLTIRESSEVLAADSVVYMSDNFLDISGKIKVELDMILLPEQFKLLYKIMNKKKANRHRRKATRSLVYRWTDRAIPYEFVTPHFNVDEVFYIRAAMSKWEKHTCLTFRPSKSSDKNKIRFQNGNGCNSMLGMVGGVQPINLQSPGCRYSGLYLHEIGHAIGLVHEHQLPDRDQYIYIVYDNVAPSMRIWFNKYSRDEVNQYSVPYEYSSVMHYGVTAFSKDGYSQTIKAKYPQKEQEIGRVYAKGLSFSDIKVVNKMYNCGGHCTVDPECQEPAYVDKYCKCIKPVSSDSTTKPTAGCYNIWSDTQCGEWADVGECTVNPHWMKENCKKACQACGDGIQSTTPDTATCSNLWGDVKCNEWAERAECEANPMWMKEYCKKACSICSNMHSEDDGEKDLCMDNNQYCQEWASSGYCSTNWYTKENCNVSCNTCSQHVVAKDGVQTNDVANMTPVRATIYHIFIFVLCTSLC